ncbi:MAG: 2,4-dihydroxyhept-2-ene-1,7-dioic acid aldolase [Anaerolineaceae bacterium]|nr:2,4-dihydroxyhept-2-ene-1,7-dioic acid aldolase [Anaerolineaceae bacterium]
MKHNALKSAWKERRATLNGWLHIPSMWSTEVMARAGFDSLTVDMQHGLMGLDSAIQMLQAISTTNTVALARSTWNEPGTIGRLLDAGAMGIICPMVNNRAECEQFVGACRYHPVGYRSLGPTRAKVLYGDDYTKHANEDVLALAMIETKEALDNVDEIASVPGLSGFYIGPGDLRLSLMGAGGLDNEDAEFLAALDTILAAAKRQGIVTGIHCNSAVYAQKMIERGFDMVTLQTDSGLLSAAATSIVNQMRGIQPQQRKSESY